MSGLFPEQRHFLLSYHQYLNTSTSVCKSSLYVFSLPREKRTITNVIIGNSQLPQYAQTNLVNIYLISATNQAPILSWLDQPNPPDHAGLLHAPVNDTWFGDRGSLWSGSNVTFLFQWVVTPSTVTLDSSAIPQPIFTAVRE